MNKIPNSNVVFANEYKTSYYIKNAIKAPNIYIGDYTYYDAPVDPTEFGDKLVIVKFCSIVCGS